MSMPYTRHLIHADVLFGPRPSVDKDWKRRAICSEYQHLFLADFPQTQITALRKNEQKTQAICLVCPVRLNCLWAALDANEKDLMWGGMNADQRGYIRRKLKMKDENVA